MSLSLFLIQRVSLAFSQIDVTGWTLVIAAVGAALGLNVIIPIVNAWFGYRRERDKIARDLAAENAKIERDRIAEEKAEARESAKLERDAAVATEAKRIADNVALVARVQAEKSNIAGKEALAAIADVSSVNKAQHKMMNSELEKFKEVIEQASLARGVLQGRKDLQAELDSKSAAIAGAAKGPVTSATSSPLPVTDEKVLEVLKTVPKKKPATHRKAIPPFRAPRRSTKP